VFEPVIVRGRRAIHLQPEATGAEHCDFAHSVTTGSAAKSGTITLDGVVSANLAVRNLPLRDAAVRPAEEAAEPVGLVQTRRSAPARLTPSSDGCTRPTQGNRLQWSNRHHSLVA
jgi:hypothetical protein